MINRKVARRYTLAMYEIGLEKNALDKLKEDFSNIEKSITGSGDLRLFLSTPLINERKKESTIKALFEGKVSDITLLFLQILCRKGRENLLNDISVDFLDLLNEKTGVVAANIKTAIEISETEKQDISRKLETFSGKKTEATFSVDPDIKGGFVARVKDTIIDASIKRQLELLYEQFKSGSFKSN